MTWYNLTGAPVPFFADPGQVVGLRTLLERAYGAEAVSQFGQITVTYRDDPGYSNFSHWDPNNRSVTEVLYNGEAIGTNGFAIASGASGLDAISLRAGNLIFANVNIAIQTNVADNTYQALRLQTVPARFEDARDGDGVVSAWDIVASARALAAAYNGTPNFNDCHYIASTIASATGASFPTLSGSFDPGQNEDSGFWRVVHRGSDNPVQNWQQLVRPGDVVRLEWPSGGVGHTFTVTSGLNGAGLIQVVDNGHDRIWEHWVDYDGALSQADSVTIYRLTDDGLNLINGSPYGDTLHGTVWNDTFQGYGGVDYLRGGLGNDTYVLDRTGQYTPGSFNFSYHNVIEKADQGTDTVLVARAMSYSFDSEEYFTGYGLGANVENGTVIGTDAFDLHGNELANQLLGNAAANILNGLDGNDTLRGGGGNDGLLGGNGIDILHGEGGDDILRGGGDGDRLHGGFQTETESEGIDGSDTLYGEGGDDVLVVSYANDILDGGEGNDTLSFEWMDADLQIDLASGTASFTEGGSIPASGPGTWTSMWVSSVDVVWTGMENLTGGAGADRLTGDQYANVIEGRGGDDGLYGEGGDDVLHGGLSRSSRLSGVDGDDHLHGGAGNDTLIASFGHDLLDGGSGNDTLSFAWVGADLKISLGQGSTSFMELGHRFRQSEVATEWVNIENLTGGLGDDSLTGTRGDNVLIGGAGRDVLTGGAGSDLLAGGIGDDVYRVDTNGDRVVEALDGGRDTVRASASYQLKSGQEIEVLTTDRDAGTAAIRLSGNETANLLRGNAGDNVLDGKSGQDVLYGLGGSDTFVFSKTLGAGNVDRIADFSAVADTIRLSGDIFDTLGLGTLAKSAFKDVGVAGAVVDRNDRILYDHDTGVLSYDADGSGAAAATRFAVLANHAALTAQDFLVA